MSYAEFQVTTHFSSSGSPHARFRWFVAGMDVPFLAPRVHERNSRHRVPALMIGAVAYRLLNAS